MPLSRKDPAPPLPGRGDLLRLAPYEEGRLRIVVETPKGSPFKLAFDSALGLLRLDRHLPAGLTYPHDWGFVPGTLAADGDPLDALLLSPAPGHPGLLALARPLHLLRLTQRAKGGGRERNDRVIAVPSGGAFHARSLTAREREELAAFFLASVAFEDKDARIQGWAGPAAARRAVAQARRAFLR